MQYALLLLYAYIIDIAFRLEVFEILLGTSMINLTQSVCEMCPPSTTWWAFITNAPIYSLSQKYLSQMVTGRLVRRPIQFERHWPRDPTTGQRGGSAATAPPALVGPSPIPQPGALKL